jgi:hypothetical protein
MKEYQFVKPEIKEKQLAEALERGLGRQLDEREKRYVKWHSNCDYETSGLLLDWILELSKVNDQSWFWSDEWQKGEKEADEEIKQGNVKTYDNLEDFLKSLEEKE